MEHGASLKETATQSAAHWCAELEGTNQETDRGNRRRRKLFASQQTGKSAVTLTATARTLCKLNQFMVMRQQIAIEMRIYEISSPPRPKTSGSKHGERQQISDGCVPHRFADSILFALCICAFVHLMKMPRKKFALESGE